MRRFVVGAVLWGIAAFAHAGQEIKVEATSYPSGFRIRFPVAMQVMDNAVLGNRVQVSPATSAHTCTWTDDTEIACAFVKDLPLATRFQVKLAPDLLQAASGARLPASSLAFETKRPWMSAQVEWKNRAPRILLYSPLHKVSLEAARDALRVTIDGTKIPVVLTDRQDSHFQLELPERKEEATVEVRIAPGLRADNGPLRGTQDASIARVVIGEAYRVRGVVCAGLEAPIVAAVRAGRASLAGCVPNERIRLHLSHAPASAAVEAWKRQWPEGVRYLDASDAIGGWGPRPERTDVPRRAPGWWIEFEIDARHAQKTLSIPAMPASGIAPAELLDPVEIDIATNSSRPSLFAPFDRALLESGASPGVNVVNIAPQPLRIATVGRDATVTTLRTPTAADAPVPVEPDGVRRTLEDGGFVDWRAEVKPGEFTSAAMAAAPEFDVFALAATREAVVWAHAWESRAPIADANAELLLRRSPDAAPERVARAKTNVDGMAVITLPSDFVPPHSDDEKARPQWFVRVERAGSRAVLPLQLGGYGADRILAKAKAHGFGIADRPIYRAGDTVRWRLWSREWRDGALLPASPSTSEIALTNFHGRPITTSRTHFDASGSASGETVLPAHLTDDDYCIGLAVERSWYHSGAARVCFRVGTYRAQDLWMRARTDARVVRDGDTIPFDIEAGYYSGGVAAGARIDGFAAELLPLSIGEAYSAWRDYAFASPDGSGSDFDGVDDLAPTTDAAGRAHIPVPVALRAPKDGELPTFGRIRMSAEVQLSDRESTTSNAVEVLYARFARHVGLKLEPRWLDARSPVTLQGVVVDSEGRDVSAGSIDVEVFFSERDDEGTRTKVHACTLEAGRPGDCSFDRSRSGYYRIVAKQGDAAPADYTTYVWSASDTTKRMAPLELERGEEAMAGTSLRVIVSKRVAGPVLFVISSDDRVLDARVVHIDAGKHPVDLPTQSGWPREGQVRAYARGDASDKPLPPGFRRPVPMHEDRTPYALGEIPRMHVPVTVAFEPVRAAPGDKVRITLHNTTNTPRNVTLAVVDDALRAQGAGWLSGMDPRNMHALLGVGWDELHRADFGAWNQGAWRWIFRRPKDVDPCPQDSPTCVVPVVGGRVNPIDVSSVETATILSAGEINQIPLSRETTNVALLAPGTAAAPPPPPQESGDQLETVEVLGSSIDPIEPPVVFDEPSPVDASRSASKNGKDAIPPTRGPPRPLPELARVRTHFADTALWRSDIVLAPGETRVIDFASPDNLTRWRAVAWSDDGRSDIAMAEAALEAGLPVEARLQSPARIYPGDHARIAANIRHVAPQSAEAHATLKVLRGTHNDTHATMIALPAQGQASFGVAIAPDAPGTLLLTAAAATDAGNDAIAAPLEVASTTIAARRSQAGWIGAAPLALQLPKLPEGAHDAQLRVSVWRGNDALIHGWTEDLRDYPHRCWEQILSRAVAAALAIDRSDPSWPDAKAVVQEALENAAVFQDSDGGMRFFPQAPDSAHEPAANVSLTAYTVDAFALLRSLGHATPDFVEEWAREFLAGHGNWEPEKQPDERAIAAAVVDRPEDLAKLSSDHATLALPARVSAARALARAGDAQAGPAIAGLLERAPKLGEARVLERGGDWSLWMSSPLREQCELIRLLQDFPHLAPTGTRDALVRGLGDLHAGGVPQVDTQTGASCLRALHGERANDAREVVVDASVGAQRERVVLRNGELRSEVSFDAGGADTLSIVAPATPVSPVAYLARIDYNEDARRTQATAIGFSIERRYEVLRNHKWSPLGEAPLRDGDWVRITLVISNAKTRHFVAVTDDLPGGLRPVDLSLAGVAGVDMEALGSRGDWAFYERKLDALKPKFYADLLWPGRHEIHYFTRVANSGEYLAAPAVAELMYGEATRARTAADRLRIADPAPTPDLDLAP